MRLHETELTNFWCATKQLNDLRHRGWPLGRDADIDDACAELKGIVINSTWKRLACAAAQTLRRAEPVLDLVAHGLT